MSVFEEQFESFVPEALQWAYAYVEGDDAVTRFWVAYALEDAVSAATAVYEIQGKVLQAHEVSCALPDLDDSPDMQGVLQRGLLDAVRPYKHALIEAEVDHPTFLVLRYDVEDEAMEADMTYAALQPGVPAEELATHGMLLDRWAARLQATGVDSPEL